MAKLQNDLKEMKKNKVELMKRITEETRKAQKEQMANAKRVANMEKDARKKENVIQQLQSKDRQREEFMRRNNEELLRLRKEKATNARNTVCLPSSNTVSRLVRQPLLVLRSLQGLALFVRMLVALKRRRSSLRRWRNRNGPPSKRRWLV